MPIRLINQILLWSARRYIFGSESTLHGKVSTQMKTVSMDNPWNIFVFPSIVSWMLAAVIILLIAILYNVRHPRLIPVGDDVRGGSRILKWGVNFCNNVIEPKPG